MTTKPRLGLIFIALLILIAKIAAQQSPVVSKIEPPNWWANHSINPVRVMIRGENLKDASVTANSTNLKLANIKTSDNGHYLFADVIIAKNTKIGKYNFEIRTAKGTAVASFEISAPLARQGHYQGFTPDDVIYFLLPDRFSDGDASNNDPAKSKGLYDRSKGRFYHGGDLQGVINHLDYIKSLGATAVWTTPVYDNNDKLDFKEVYEDVNGVKQPSTGYHGYGATDFYALDEHLGDMAKLRELIEKAHAQGLKVIQDQVANHTGPYHVWANDPPTPTWFNGTLDNHLDNNWQKWTAMNARATYQTQARNIDGWFIDILPDLNQRDPEVEKYLIQNTLWWMGMAGFDSIRMDTLPHVPRTFWKQWMTAIKREYPNVNVLGELYDGDPALLAYFQAGHVGSDGIDTKIDTLYDYGLFYPLRSAFGQGQSIRPVSQMFAHDWLYPNPNVLVTFFGLHDMERFMNEKGASVEGLKLAQTLIMTARGTPLLYYGDELAMPGGGDPDNRRDFPGGFQSDKQNAFNSNERTIEESDVWNYLAKLGALRKELEPLRRGKTLDLYDGELQMAYARIYNKKTVIVVFNNDIKPATIEFEVNEDKSSSEASRDEKTGEEREKFVRITEYARPQDVQRLWLWNGTILTDRLGKSTDVKIDRGKMKATLPARSAAIFTTK